MKIFLCCFAAASLLSSSFGEVDDFYSIDSAFSWMAKREKFASADDPVEHMKKQLVELGVRNVRERMWWKWSNPSPGRYVWGQHRENARLLTAAGFKVTDLYHDAPEHTGGSEYAMPTDLLATYRYAKAAAAEFGSDATDWEFWNEQDEHNARDGAWAYTAAFKAASLGFRDGNPQAVVLPGAVCRNERSDYEEVMCRNGLALYADAYNFHQYIPVDQWESRLKELRAFLDTHGFAGRAYLITEFGFDFSSLGLARDRVEALQAEHLVKSLVLQQMAGAARSYPFVHGVYRPCEGLSLMRADGTVKPAFNAYRDLIRAVGESHLVGELDAPADIRAFLFENSRGHQTVCYWKTSPEDAGKTGPGDGGEGAAATTRFSLSGRSLTATPMPQYAAGLTGLKAVRPAAGRGAIRREEVPVGIDARIVLRADFDRQAFVVSGGKSFLEMNAKRGRATIEVYNFEACEKRGRLVVHGMKLTGNPEVLTLPPFGKACVAGELMPLAPRVNEMRMEFVRTDGRKSTPLAVRIDNVASVHVEKLSRCGAAAWNLTSSAKEKTIQEGVAGEVVFSGSFAPDVSDRWMFAAYRGDDEIGNAASVVFEIRAKQDLLENAYRHSYVCFQSDDGRKKFVRYAAPVENWETRRVSVPTDIGQIKAFSIGLGPLGKKLTYALRNVGVEAKARTGVWNYRPYEYEAWMLQEMRREVDCGVLRVNYPGKFPSPKEEPEAFWSAQPVAGYEPILGSPDVPPHRLPRPEKKVALVFTNGVWDVGREDIGYVRARARERPTLFVGESLAEALNDDYNGFEQSTKMIREAPGLWRSEIPLALRYFRIAEKGVKDISFSSQVIDREPVGSFVCGDARKERIWQIAADTLAVCRRTFILDGVKRDRLPWAGDLALEVISQAYVSGDPEPVKRTLAALGSGKVSDGPINGIGAFSLWWIISHDLLQRYFGDASYLQLHYPRIRERMAELATHEDERGYYVRNLGWDFMDWMDRAGAMLKSDTTRQVLYFAALKAAARLADRVGDAASSAAWTAKAGALRTRLLKDGMDRTRHARMLAIVFDMVDGELAKRYAREIVRGDLPPTVTPYMASFEVWALAKTGERDAALKRFESVWGAMTDFGVNTYWEGWDAADGERERYVFYARPFAKSLCHAWASGPAFLIPGVFLGWRPTSDGWATWERKPTIPDYAPNAKVVIPALQAPSPHAHWDNGRPARCDS